MIRAPSGASRTSTESSAAIGANPEFDDIVTAAECAW